MVNAEVLPKTLDESYSFEHYVQDFGKIYSGKDRNHREKIFSQNLEKILRHNKRADVSYALGANKFMDMESHELPTGYDKSFHKAWRGERHVVSERQLRGSYNFQVSSTMLRRPLQMLLEWPNSTNLFLFTFLYLDESTI